MAHVCVCARVCACVRARARVFVWVCEQGSQLTAWRTFLYLCVHAERQHYSAFHKITTIILRSNNVFVFFKKITMEILDTAVQNPSTVEEAGRLCYIDTLYCIVNCSQCFLSFSMRMFFLLSLSLRLSITSHHSLLCQELCFYRRWRGPALFHFNLILSLLRLSLLLVL